MAEQSLVVLHAEAGQVRLDPEHGWSFFPTVEQLLAPSVQEARARAERENVGAMLRVVIGPDNPNPTGALTIVTPDGKVFKMAAEPVDADVQSVKDGLLLANPPVDSAAIVAAQHRSGVSVNSRTLRSPDHQEVNGKAENTLIDDLAFGTDTFIGATPTHVRKTIERAMRVARGYIIDEKASFRLGELCVDAAAMIADNQEFARIPFPVVWAEFDQRSVLEGMRSRGGQVFEGENFTPDDRLGFLYTGHGVYTAARTPREGFDGMHVGWSPFAFRMGRPTTLEQQRRWRAFFGEGEDVLDRFLWGNAYDRLDRSRRAALRHYSGIDILLPDSMFEGRTEAPLRPMLQGGGAGDWKLALATLLVLIRPGVAVQNELRKPMRKLSAKGPRKLISLSSVTINISRTKTRSLIKRGLADARRATRWHEVRGHYMHNRVAREADCIHDWQEVEPNRWTCRHCEGKRAWREYPNGRGSATAGLVAKNYKVTSKRG